MDSSGRVLTKQRGRSVPAFERTLAALAAYEKSRAKARAGDAPAKIDVLIAEMELGMIKNHVLAEGRLDGLPAPDPDQRRRLDAALADLEVAYVLRRRRRDPDKVGGRFAGMFAKGRVPRQGRHASYFWQQLLGWAARRRDADLLERALEAARRSLPPRRLATWKKRLARLRRL